MFDRIRKYLKERDVNIRHRTVFDDEPCYRCQEFDPWLDISGASNYDYLYEQKPCDHRRNYCHTWNPLCKDFKEAGKGFWSSEKWRIENKPEYRFMNANQWRNYRPSCQKAIEK